MFGIKFRCNVRSALKRIEQRQIILERKVRFMMATLDEVLELVTLESGQIDSMIALMTGLQEQLAEALAGTTLPPLVQAKVDAIFTQAKEDSEEIVAALAANSPPVDPPVDPDPVTP